MKRLAILLLLGILAALSVAPLMAQDATAEATMEPAVSYDPAACFAAAANNDKMVKYDAKPGPYTIGISNSYIGNAWRTQMLQMAQAFAQTDAVKPLIKDLVVVSTGDDVEAQIAAIDNMISLGVDAIVINAINPTSFDAVVKRAADAGIIVVSFDGIVDAPESIIVNEDQVEFGAMMAQDLADRMGGKGNVIMVNGVPGTSVDSDRISGAKGVFEKYPDIKITAELEGRWDSGTAQTVVSDFLATQPQVDGVWAQGGDPGVLQAFKDAGYDKLPPMAGEAENGFRMAMGDGEVQGISIGQTPGMVAVSMQAALELLQGRELPRVISMPLPAVTSEDIQSGVHYFPDLPADFFTPIKIPVCGVDLDPDAILAVKVDGQS
ncbi:MAG: sugar ABC transporter substrate-binding protein [Chloroflexota bacterium]